MKTYKDEVEIFEIGGTFDVTIYKKNIENLKEEFIRYRETFLESWEVGQIMGGN